MKNKLRSMASLVAALCIVFTYSSCSDNNSTENEELKAQVEALQSQMAEMTTTSESELSSTASAETAEDKNEGEWEKRFYLDKFDNPTDEPYLSTKNPIKGKFSNSATDDSDLNVIFVVDRNKMTISLYEYGNKLVKNSYSNDKKYLVYFQRPNSEEKLVIGTMISGYDRIVIDNNCDSEYIDGQLSWADGMYRILLSIENFDETKFYIVDADNPVTNYSFSVLSSNLKDIYYDLYK